MKLQREILEKQDRMVGDASFVEPTWKGVASVANPFCFTKLGWKKIENVKTEPRNTRMYRTLQKGARPARHKTFNPTGDIATAPGQ